jgi:hypothetical protein
VAFTILLLRHDLALVAVTSAACAHCTASSTEGLLLHQLGQVQPLPLFDLGIIREW